MSSGLGCTRQGQRMRKELGQLEALWQRPDTSGFAELGAN